MPICTYITQEELMSGQHTSDVELNELITEVRKIDDRYYLREFVFADKKLFRKPKHIKVYNIIYEYIKGCVDVQLINFYRPNGSSIYTEITAEIAAAYLMGILNGNKVEKTTRTKQ